MGLGRSKLSCRYFRVHRTSPDSRGHFWGQPPNAGQIVVFDDSVYQIYPNHKKMYKLLRILGNCWFLFNLKQKFAKSLKIIYFADSVHLACFGPPQDLCFSRISLSAGTQLLQFGWLPCPLPPKPCF